MAYFKLHFFSGDRPSDLSHIKAAEILRFPNDKGLIFNHVFGKTLRSGDSKVFAVARHPNQFFSPVKALDDYMTICQAIRIPVPTGPLFRATCGQSVLIDAFSTDASEARLKTYLTAAGLTNKTLYSFRCGGALAARWMTLLIMSAGVRITWPNTICSSINRFNRPRWQQRWL